MALSKLPYKGTRDFFPQDMRFRNHIFKVMSDVSELFAYEPYDGPVLEEVELYLAKSGEELITEQIYSFKDRGDRLVAIRPEMTPTVARMVSQIHREVAKPLRWYAIPNLMRYEKMQRGRLREFWQYNADIFGAGEHGDMEIIQLSVEIMKRFGANASQFEILINDRRLVDHVFKNQIGLDPESTKKLYKLVDRKNKMPAEKFAAEIRAITSDETKAKQFEAYVNLKSIDDVKAFVGSSEDAAPLLRLFSKLHEVGLKEFVRFDPSIVRGLDYYTGMVFEIFDKHPDNNRAIAGGGSYANLLQIFNEPPLEGVGIGLGEVPLSNFLEAHGLKPDFSKPVLDVVIGCIYAGGESIALNVSSRLRSENLKVELIPGETKPKKVFAVSDKKDCKAVIFVGENEANAGKVQVKNLITKAVTEVDFNDVKALVSAVKGI